MKGMQGTSGVAKIKIYVCLRTTHTHAAALASLRFNQPLRTLINPCVSRKQTRLQHTQTNKDASCPF